MRYGELESYGRLSIVSKIKKAMPKIRRKEYIPINMGRGIVKELRKEGMLR